MFGVHDFAQHEQQVRSIICIPDESCDAGWLQRIDLELPFG
jgi:hypothetical protein